MPGPERTLENRLRRGISAAGGCCWKLSPISQAGIPDRLVLMPGGRVYFIEMKRPGGKLTELQAHVHEILRDLGFDVRVLDNNSAVDIFVVEVDADDS